MEINRLYPQYRYPTDRRQNTIPVEFERRSGVDRRAVSRTTFDLKLQQDLNDTFTAFRPVNIEENKPEEKKENIFAATINSVPYFRRFSGMENSINNNDYVKAAGIGFLQLINVKEDWRDITKIFKPSAVPHDFQVPFSFTRGTLLEKFHENRFINKLMQSDITLYDIPAFQKLLYKLGMTKEQFFNTGKYDKLDNAIYAYKVEGKALAKVLGRTFMRIPVLSLIFLSLLEIPSIIKSQDPVKQTLKSATNVSSTIMCGALLGAIGAFVGPLGSLLGLGIGSYLGNQLAKKINSKQ